MKVSIITIAYNSEASIVKTIESVLTQSYGHIEYLIIDGDSSDGTVAAAERYRKAFAEKGIEYHIYSEPDHGIYDAMNKGIRLASGDIIGFLNCGDWYESGTINTAVRVFRKTDCELMFGNIRIHKKDGSHFVKRAKQRKYYQTSRDWNHPTMFVRSELHKRFPFIDLGIHDDYGFYLKMRKQNRRIVVVNKVLANFSMGGASNNKSLREAMKRIQDRYQYCYRRNGYSRWYLVECIFIEAAKLILG